MTGLSCVILSRFCWIIDEVFRDQCEVTDSVDIVLVFFHEKFAGRVLSSECMLEVWVMSHGGAI
jgi:hypothetical protein